MSIRMKNRIKKMNNFQTQPRTIVENRELRSDKYMCNEHIPNFLNKELKAKRDEVFSELQEGKPKTPIYLKHFSLLVGQEVVNLMSLEKPLVEWD